MKQVFIARDRAEADRTCRTLLEAGLNAVVQGDPDGFPSVWVSGEDAERAHQLLRQWAQEPGTPEDEPG